MPRLTTQQKANIVEEYQNDIKLTCSDISRKYGVNNSSIRMLLKRRGIKIRANRSILRRRYDIDENYFDNINTESKAYFLGLLYADGCNQGNKTITISLQEEDKHILEEFNKQLKTNKPLYYVNYSKKHPNWKNQYKLEIANKRLVCNLTSLGCHAKKSLSLKFPTNEQVPKHLLSHFIRGMWDGDGYIGKIKGNGKRIQVTLVSTDLFCDLAKKTILEQTGINFGEIRHKTKGIKVIVLGGFIQCKYFLDWLYKNATTYLERKYTLYRKIKKMMNKKMKSVKYTKRIDKCLNKINNLKLRPI